VLKHWPSPVGIRVAAGLFWIFFSVGATGALLPPFFVDSVVALGAMQIVAEPGQQPHPDWRTEGTGFFYGFLVENDPDPQKRRYELLLVTAKHVVEGHRAMQRGNPAVGKLHVRVNPKDSSSPSQEFELPDEPVPGGGTWFYHLTSTIDVAAIHINHDFLVAHGIEPHFFANDQHSADRERLKNFGAAPGDGVFVLGFPMGLSGLQRNYVIVRQGSVARITEMLDQASPTFLIDAFVFLEIAVAPSY
jgi:hypothetical protein